MNYQLKARMLSVREVAEDGCWIWTRAIFQGSGYGMIALEKGKPRYTHRVAYELWCGPIPFGLTIDHLCRVRACFNPAHLEAVTMRENILRGTSPSAENARKTHCLHGHPLSGENLYRKPNGSRTCKTCNRENLRRFRTKATL